MFSVVVLTFNRPQRIVKQVEYLARLVSADCEVIIVDNCSDTPVTDLVPKNLDITIVRNEKNLGAVGRRMGMDLACGDFVVTLDDDVYGLTVQHLKEIEKVLREPLVGAVNFRIEDELTGKVVDWCHPYDRERFCDASFETSDISEGAVAFRREALGGLNFYPDYFFISHEGIDLAFRLITAGWRVLYCPDIKVVHGYEQAAREDWRRYYFDTRNQLWFVLRNVWFWEGAKRLLIGWGAMFVYAARDGYLRYWFKGVVDSILGARRAMTDRIALTVAAKQRVKWIERNKPGFWDMVKVRLRTRQVRI